MSQRKSILIVNLGGHIGGADKRYVNLFKSLSTYSTENTYLIINRNLYKLFEEYLDGIDNIHVLDFDKIFEYKDIQKSDNLKINGLDSSKVKKSQIRKYLGRTKYVLKLFYGWLFFNIQLIKLLKELKINSIYTVWTGGIWSWHLKYIFNYKMVYGYMDSNYESLSRSYFRFFESEYFALKHSDTVDCLSPKIAKDLRVMIDFKDSTKVIHTPNSFINYTNYYPDSNKENTIVFLARLYPLKNPMFLLEAWKLLTQDMQFHTNYQLMIIGEGPEENSLKTYVEKHSLKGVIMEGVSYQPYEYLRKSEIFVSLQENENYPSQSLIEAMACENAIIATDVGNTRLLVSEAEGILVNKDRQSLADALKTLITDETLIRKLGKNARSKVINNHTIENFVEHFDNIMK